MVNVTQEHEVLKHSTNTVVEKESESAPCEAIIIENTENSNDVENCEDYGMKDDDTLSESSELNFLRLGYRVEMIHTPCKRLMIFWI